MKSKNMAIMMTGLLLGGSALASAHHVGTHSRMCGFQENMYINSSPAGTKILSLNASGGLAVEKSTNGLFYIRDNGQCSDGTVTAKIGTDSDDYSTITISDGPLAWNPMVTGHSDHGDYSYQSMDHNSGTFDYYLHFTK